MLESIRKNEMLLVLFLLVLSAASLMAQTIPQTMNYQGRLTDNSAEPRPLNGTVEMTFEIFDSATGGSALWSEDWRAVSVVGGIFSVLLGSVTPIPSSVFERGGWYLEITVEGEVQSPRQQIGSVAYATQTEKAADSSRLGGVADTGWQKKLTVNCAGTQFLYGFTQSGSPSCATPAGTSYNAGTGLLLSGSTFSVIYGTAAGASTQGNDARLGDWLISGNNLTSGVSGNVGIGTAGAPAQKLEVVGNAKISGDLILGGAAPTFKVSNVAAPTAGSDAATKDYVDAQVAGSGGGLRYWLIKRTVGVFQGDLGGYGGANAKCAAEFGAGSVMLNSSILSSAYLGGAPIVVDSVGSGWWAFNRVAMSPGIAGSTVTTIGIPIEPDNFAGQTTNIPYSDCGFWNSGASTNFGAQWDSDAIPCNLIRQIVCAIPN